MNRRSLLGLAWILPGLFEAQPLTTTFDRGFAHLPDDRHAVATAVWPHIGRFKLGFRGECRVVGQLFEKLLSFLFFHLSALRFFLFRFG